MEREREKWKFRSNPNSLDFRCFPLGLQRGGPSFASQTPDTKTKSRSLRKQPGRKGGKAEEEEEGERERERRRPTRALVTEPPTVGEYSFVSVSASLKLNIDFACRAFQAGLRSNRGTPRNGRRADKRGGGCLATFIITTFPSIFFSPPDNETTKE